ncbi:protein FRA10AC1 isoform X2 [Polypterus senegalus]|uniref:protein FRA10AC1 isoform X2 n=1 Tax=Polypterus senegalus TaxID=55291 RepID=UPI0019644DFD|nr:protein FRA10AC1 isoform X2 [Polypterus senegalus]
MDRHSINLVKEHGRGGYNSDFSDDEHGEASDHKRKRTHKDDPLMQKTFQKERHVQLPHKSLAAKELDREEARSRRHHLISMNAYDRHKQLVRDYILFYGGKEGDFKRCTTNDKTDLDVIRENHRFLWREEDEEDLTWEKQLAKKYYDKLFKEYCIADLSRYKENKIGFRWRVEKEVISGKGQFFCGNKFCNKKEGLKSWEVNFGYIEHGEKKNALVKLRLCPECSYKLNYHHRRKEVKASKTCQEQYSQEEPAVKKSKSSSKTKHTHKKRSDNLPPSSKSTEESDEDSKESEDLSESQYWKGPAPNVDEKTREEEFDEYFQDMFL